MLSRMSLNVATRAVTKSQFFTKNHATNRSLHIICQARITSVPNVLNCKTNVEKKFNRHASTDVIDSFQIPSPPIAPVIINQSSAVTETISEVTQAGLGTSWTPVSLIEHSLEFLHATVGLPWWGSIVAVTLVARILCFPLIIKAQRNMINMSEYMPEFQALQRKLSKARKDRDILAVEQYAQDISVLMRGREFDGFKTLAPTVLQGSVAVSVFLALRHMTTAPLKSMEEGGLWWFTNLCVTDPYYILPAMSSTTLLLLIFHSSKLMPMPETFKRWLILGIPCLTFLFIKSFPAGTLVYWVTTNSVTLLQQQVLTLKPVREYFDLKDVPKISNPIFGGSSTFKDVLRENMENMKVTQQVYERETIKDLEKKRVGRTIESNKETEAPKVARKRRSM